MEKAKFRAMSQGDAQDYQFLHALELEYAGSTVDWVLLSMQDLKVGMQGYQVSRYEHSLQSASRAWRDGADVDWVVAALLHDIGDGLAPYNHDEYAALLIRPFVREQVSWCIEKHARFQLIYFGHFIGVDPNKRDAFKEHAYFEDCVTFCERWDQSSFDPDYDTLPLEFFEPMLRDVFVRPVYDLSYTRPGERLPLVDREMASQRCNPC